MRDTIELCLYFALSMLLIWQMRGIASKKPFWSAANAKAVIFTAGLLAVVLRYWWGWGN